MTAGARERLTERLAPCPRCGSNAVAVYHYGSGTRHVECDACLYLGPGAGSIRAAIKLHNKRCAETEGGSRG